MKKLLTLTVVLFAVMLGANNSDFIETFGDKTNISMERTYSENSDIAEYKVLAIPAEDIEIEINKMTVSYYDDMGKVVKTIDERDNSRVTVSDKFTFREMRGFSVKIDNIVREDDLNSVITSLDFSVNPVGTFEYPTEIAESFVPAYASMVDNWDSCYLRNLPYAQPSLLIMGNNLAFSNAYFPEFVKWKRQLGFDVVTLPKEQLGSSAEEIKESLEGYCNANGFPEYMLIIGDVNDAYEFPSFYHSAENDVSDLGYTLLAGDDYLPESIIGRFSIDSSSELMTVIAKTLFFEKYPEMSDTDWMTKALVIAGNHADEPPIPVTPVLMSRWIYHELIDAGYTDVDTVFYPGTYPGTNEIVGYMNEGRQFISYRGWGAADGWHFPEFHKEDIDYTNTGAKMPVVTSIVCNTGDFANPYHDPCFGEAWMSKGSPSSPAGCVAFVGPSDLHTSTEKNNAISSGIYWSILHEGNRSFGSAVLRGKTELYNNYPNDRETNGQVEFYYRVYNILCDPTLNMWVKIPNTADVNLPNTISQGTNYLQFNVPASLEGATITSSLNNISFERNIVRDGIAFIDTDTSEPGELVITLSKKNTVPIEKKITVTAAEAIGVTDYYFNNLYAASTATIDVTVKNYGSSAQTGVTAILSCDNPAVSILDEQIVFGDIASGYTSNVGIQAVISPDFDNYDAVEFVLEFSTGETAKLYSTLEHADLNVTDMGDIAPGFNGSVSVDFVNGGQNLASATVTVTPLCDAVTVTQANFDLPAMTQGQTASGSFEVSVEQDVFNGRQAAFQFDLVHADGRNSRTYYTTVIGNVETTDPTGKDKQGYYAYDNFDTDYPASPVYEWIECDPEYGGSGTVLIGEDDESWTIDLPFEFKYYGIDYNQITICTNGWISMGETWMTNFRNWNIPAALGPKAQIAAYWDDLKGLVQGDNLTQMRISYWFDSANNRFVVQWRDTYNQHNNTSVERFQVVLSPKTDMNGDITINFAEVDDPDDNGNYCTVGIENYAQTDGICYVYANHYAPGATPLQNELAIKFTMDAPDNYTGIDENNPGYEKFVLNQNIPNPFNPETEINFVLNEDSNVSLDIYNVKGQKVKTLVSGKLTKGNHDIVWSGKDDNGTDVSSGIYFYRLTSGKLVRSKKMILLK
ncbi:MAG: hypothetical protein CSB55_07335 [Candidatus Cloacimonadota bacterium]|nr:MAG: hypothetical protein CSB55_07335 [Candidatus Cloacimonadota bacterium]